MKIDFDKGAFIEIGGELGKYNSLPIDDLVKIAQDLQELIFTIAKYDLSTNEPIDINNFKIELVGFSKGSAVPKFAYTQRTENKTGMYWQVHRNQVNEKFEQLIEVAHSGDYGKVLEMYPEPIKRNPIVETLYAFTNDFGNAPVSFIDYDEKNEKITPIYKINRFKSSLKNQLIVEITEQENSEIEKTESVGRIREIKSKGKTRYKVLNSYSKDKFSLEYAPTIIVGVSMKFLLKHPLRCLFQKEGDYFVIQSEMLDLIGTGITENDAEKSFGEEFEYIYQRLNSLQDDELTNHNQLIKSILNSIVAKVEA